MKLYKELINGKEIQVADYPGENGPIVAIHGLTGNYKNMHYYANRLKGNYRFISIDLPGRGNSDAPIGDTSIFNHARDVTELMHRLKLDQAILIGHSMGAFISSIIASETNLVRGVILLDGAAKMSNHQHQIVQPSLGRYSKKFNTKEDYISSVKEIYKRLNVEWTNVLESIIHYEVQEVNGYWRNKSDEKIIRQDWDTFYDYNPEIVCSNIDCPVLLVYAEGRIGPLPPLFRLSDYDLTIKNLKDVEIFHTPSSHYTMIFEDRIEIHTAIEKFLKKII